MKDNLPIWQEDAVPVPFGPAQFFDVTMIQAGIIVRTRKKREVVFIASNEEAVDLALVILNAYKGEDDGRIVRSGSPRYGMDRDSI